MYLNCGRLVHQSGTGYIFFVLLKKLFYYITSNVNFKQQTKFYNNKIQAIQFLKMVCDILKGF